MVWQGHILKIPTSIWFRRGWRSGVSHSMTTGGRGRKKESTSLFKRFDIPCMNVACNFDESMRPLPRLFRAASTSPRLDREIHPAPATPCPPYGPGGAKLAANVAERQRGKWPRGREDAGAECGGMPAGGRRPPAPGWRAPPLSTMSFINSCNLQKSFNYYSCFYS